MALLTENNVKTRIDLSSPQGNASYLIGVANKICKKLGFDHTIIESEMKSSDYVNLVYVFNREFGQLIDLVLIPEVSIEKIKKLEEEKGSKSLVFSSVDINDLGTIYI